MARFVSNIDTNLDDVGLNAFLEFETSRVFQNDANLLLQGKTFADALTINADGGEGIIKLIMYGPNLSHAGSSKTLSGTVTGFQQLDTTTNDFWQITGLNVSATLFMTALRTPGTTDDLNLVKQMFVSNDQFFLSDFEDDWHGYKGNDRLDGKSGNDQLFGDSGKDKLNGGAGSDFLSGGSNKDTLRGGLDGDKLSGGTGRDKYLYKKLDEAGDIITKFETGEKFVFEGKAFGLGTYAGKLKAKNFTSSNSNVAGDNNDFFIFEKVSKILWFDSDGDGTLAEPIMIADLANKFTLHASDITII